MNEQIWWYAARSSGIVAWVLITASIVWGLSLSTRITGQKLTPAWLLDLHRYLAGSSVIFTAIHLGSLAADSWVYFGWLETFVPFYYTPNYPADTAGQFEVGIGVLALYFMMAIQLTSLMMRRLPRKVWRWVHWSSWPLFVLATYHGIYSGTDVKHPLYRYVALASVGAVFFLSMVRFLAPSRARRSAARPTPTKPSVSV
jgi:predicted ferric reductase